MAKKCKQCSQRPGRRYYVINKYRAEVSEIILCKKCHTSHTDDPYWAYETTSEYYTSRAEAAHAQVTTALMQHM